VTCPECQTRVKDWNGSDPKCAFDKRGRFKRDNWNCAAMNRLRDSADYNHMRDRYDDNSVCVARLPTGWALLEFYKERGAVDAAWFVGDGKPRPLTLDDLTRTWSEV